MNEHVSRLWYRLLRRIGMKGLLGLALLASACALAAWTPRLQRDAVDIRQAATVAQRSLAGAVDMRGRTPSTRQQLQEFAATMPPASQTAADLKVVFAAAQRHNVSLHKGEYQLKVEPNSPFVTYAATFPVKERYSSVKDFAADVLRTLPHAAMEDLRLERSDAGSPMLDARIRITFVYRAS